MAEDGTQTHVIGLIGCCNTLATVDQEWVKNGAIMDTLYPVVGTADVQIPVTVAVSRNLSPVGDKKEVAWAFSLMLLVVGVG